MTPTEIINRVCKVSGIPKKVLTGQGRTRFAVWCRFIAMNEIATQCPWLSRSEVAGYLGKKDHTSASHALSAHATLIETDKAFAALSERFFPTNPGPSAP